MLKLIKKFFSRQEIPQEKIELNDLPSWLEDKVFPLNESLKNKVNLIIDKIDNESKQVVDNLKKLDEAKLQNPNIPDRAKMIMEGNRSGFIKKVNYFFDNLDFKYNNYKELMEMCKSIENEVQQLGKGTAKSYQVLNEFFARQAENIAINIKKVESYSKEIIEVVNKSRVLNLDKIKNDVYDLKNKIKLKETYTTALEIADKNLADSKINVLQIEDKISDIKSRDDYRIYQDMLSERDKVKSELIRLESNLNHDFSTLEKALKKYAKIAFENEKVILDYLNNPMITLIKDIDFKIFRVLESIKNSISELDLDEKKQEKTLAKIQELDTVYFSKIKDDHANFKNHYNKINLALNTNNAKKELDLSEHELREANKKREDTNSKITNISIEIEKIDIEELKDGLSKEITNLVNVKITL